MLFTDTEIKALKIVLDFAVIKHKINESELSGEINEFVGECT